MVAKVRIQDGTPIWLSAAVIPSRDLAASPSSSPSVAAINVGSTDVFVYVKVDNTGTEEVGCDCGASGAWVAPTAFAGFITTGVATPPSRGGFTFRAQAGGDTIQNDATGAALTLGNPASGRRAWAWSPDNRFFAYAYGPAASGRDWRLKIVALNGATRANGAAIAPGTIAVQHPAAADPALLYTTVWNASNFRWVASEAVFCSGMESASGLRRVVACPRTPVGSAYTDLDTSGLTWVHRSSPCGSVVAFLASVTAPATRDIKFISTAVASAVALRRNNVAVAETTNGPSPSISTVTHTALGVSIDRGAGAVATVDDPDCTATGGGMQVHVDRVRASTLPAGNTGVVSVGTSAVGRLPVGGSAWVQVVNTVGWANQGVRHWCLLAQAYTLGAAIPRPWDGQAAAPPPFPISLEHCAQRNINIEP